MSPDGTSSSSPEPIEALSLEEPLLDYTRKRIHDPSKTENRNHLIAIEGLDGTGKTTAATTLAMRLNCISLSSPINIIAREIRRRIDEVALEKPNERFDFYRMSNILDSKRYLEPTLSAGSSIVLDRYSLSTIVGNLAIGASLNNDTAIVSAYGKEPDVIVPSATVLITVDEETRQQRVHERLVAKGHKPDSLIDENIRVQQRALTIYRQLIPHGLLEVDITGLAREEVAEKIIETLKLQNIRFV